VLFLKNQNTNYFTLWANIFEFVSYCIQFLCKLQLCCLRKWHIVNSFLILTCLLLLC
jgi:hypothetical protein